MSCLCILLCSDLFTAILLVGYFFLLSPVVLPVCTCSCLLYYFGIRISLLCVRCSYSSSTITARFSDIGSPFTTLQYNYAVSLAQCQYSTSCMALPPKNFLMILLYPIFFREAISLKRIFRIVPCTQC